MKRTACLTLTVLCMIISPVSALERPDVEFKVFQFPHDMMPRIDGDTSDWDIVPEEYVIGTDQLTDEKTPGRPMDRKNLDVRVRVGWVKGLNRLYFCYEVRDDYFNAYYKRGDIFEVLVDGDLSGKDVINNPTFKGWDNYFHYQGVLGQNYHIYTPPGEGRDWAMIWGGQTWINDLPWSNYAYGGDYTIGGGGRLVLEFWITPFDYAPYDGPSRAVSSKLVENAIIGLTWTIIDYDGNNKPDNINNDNGFWSISHNRNSYRDADTCVAFRLMPLLPEFRKPTEAEWSFMVLDLDKRIVAFRDESWGEITSWRWDFDDGSTSTEQNPIHTFSRAGYFVVTLTVAGPAGEAKRIKVWDVVMK